MKYSKVHIAAIGYELAPVVITSEELEERLEPLYDKLHVAPGSLESLTGISERRYWDPNPSLSKSAAAAAKKALQQGEVPTSALGALTYTGVCREAFEPATACAVAAELGVAGGVAVFDIGNACLGVMNGILDLANRIELGQIRAGLVVSAETAREIVDVTIDRLLSEGSMAAYTQGLATLTGGSGAVAVLLTDGSFGGESSHRLLGGVQRAAPEHHELCRWGLDGAPTLHQNVPLPQAMFTDAASVLQHGVALGMETWRDLLEEMSWSGAEIDRVICHQVGAPHRDTILGSIGVDVAKDFSTFEYLGNIGTVSLPITAAIAAERDALRSGDRTAFLGIGSGLNCMMLGVEW